MSNQVKASLVDGMHLQVTTPGFSDPIPLDADAEVGGQGKGHRPLQMLLVGLAGCMSMDAVSILRKKRQVFDVFEVSIDYEQAPDHPHIYTKIQLHFKAAGESISEEALARSLELSYTKYCPASAMLNQAAEITYTYEVVSTS